MIKILINQKKNITHKTKKMRFLIDFLLRLSPLEKAKVTKMTKINNGTVSNSPYLEEENEKVLKIDVALQKLLRELKRETNKRKVNKYRVKRLLLQIGKLRFEIEVLRCGLSLDGLSSE